MSAAQKPRTEPAKKQLSHLLDEPARATPDAPCVIFDGSSSNDEGCQTTNQSLTFRQAQEALLLHQGWLCEQLEALQQKTRDSSFAPNDDVVVAYLSHNSVDLFLSVLACTSDHVRALAALLNTRWTVSEMAASLQSMSSNATTLILHGPGLEQVAAQVGKACQHETSCRAIPSLARPIGETVEKSLSNRSWSRLHDNRRMGVEDGYSSDYYSRGDALIVFTSGTSSVKGAKGVRLSHAAIAIQAAAKLEMPCQYSSKTALLASTLPFCHIGGVSNLLAVWMAGGRLVLPEETKSGGAAAGAAAASTTSSFSPERVFRSVQCRPAPLVNTLVVVPAMLFALEQHLRLSRKNGRGGGGGGGGDALQQHYPAVELIVVGGQSITTGQKQFLVQTFPSARVVQTYACTEAASSLTFYTVPLLESSSSSSTTTLSLTDDRSHKKDPASDPSHHNNNSGLLTGDCVGKPPPHVELCLVHKDKWRENGALEIIRDPFQAGIIATRGPHLMNGYWQRGTKTHDATTTTTTRCREWFVTNDLGFWDAAAAEGGGCLYFCGRVNDAIRTGGETVLASEVERIVLLHPAVDECAVFALPDARFGQVVSCALVVRRGAPRHPPPPFTVLALRDWCQQHGLAGYKRPRRVFQLQTLPKNSSGKTLKFLLVERFKESQEVHSRL